MTGPECGCGRERQLHLYHDRELPAAEAEQLEHHVRTCAACVRELGQLRKLSGMLAGAQRPAMPPEAVERIRRRTVAARHAAAILILRRLSAAAAVMLVGAGGLLAYRHSSAGTGRSIAAGGDVLFVLDRAAVAREPLPPSRRGEQIQLAQWIVNDLARPVEAR